jgi:Cu(I)/Ag(I) efflux system protein CusF
MKVFISVVSISLLFAAPSAFAQSATSAPSKVAKPAPAMTDMAEGEVRKVDKDARKITLRHGEIKQLDMPAMTMVFRVKDPSMLDKVKAGDKVKFKAEGSGGALTISEIEPAK